MRLAHPDAAPGETVAFARTTKLTRHRGRRFGEAAPRTARTNVPDDGLPLDAAERFGAGGGPAGQICASSGKYYHSALGRGWYSPVCTKP